MRRAGLGGSDCRIGGRGTSTGYRVRGTGGKVTYQTSGVLTWSESAGCRDEFPVYHGGRGEGS